MKNLTLKQIDFTTENGGVSNATRKAVKEQSLKHMELDFSNFETLPNGQLGYPVAIDLRTKETIYLKVDISVGFMPKAKSKKSKAKAEPTKMPNLFD